MFGGNFITEYLDDRETVRKHAKRLAARAHLVMSDRGDTTFARDIKQDNPETEVIFRAYNTEDHRFHEYLSAEQIWDIHRLYAIDGLIPQVWNEPSGYTDVERLVATAAKVARYAREEGKRVALPHFGVGHPSEHLLAAGVLDPLLRELSADRRPAPNLRAPTSATCTRAMSARSIRTRRAAVGSTSPPTRASRAGSACRTVRWRLRRLKKAASAG